MAFRWRAVDGPTLNLAWQLCGFQGILTSMLRNPMVFFSGDGHPKPPSSGSAHALVVMDDTMGSFFFKPEKNLEFFRLKNDPIDVYPGRLE